MADSRIWVDDADRRPLADQIIDHDLVNTSEAQLLAILVIEVRGMRAQLNELAGHVRLSRDE